MQQARANTILAEENEKLKRQMDLVKAQEEGAGGLGYQLSPEEEALVKEQKAIAIQHALAQQRVEAEKLDQQEKAQLAKQQALEIEELTQVLSDEEEGKQEAEMGVVSPLAAHYFDPGSPEYSPLAMGPAVPVANAPPLAMIPPVNVQAQEAGVADAEEVIQGGAPMWRMRVFDDLGVARGARANVLMSYFSHKEGELEAFTTNKDAQEEIIDFINNLKRDLKGKKSTRTVLNTKEIMHIYGIIDKHKQGESRTPQKKK